MYKDVEDPVAFTFYDQEKGWPLVTGPFNVVLWTPEQQWCDRREDWWAAKVGLADLPAVERIINLPWPGEERARSFSSITRSIPAWTYAQPQLPRLCNRILL
ncbi:MAG: hypothetical protein R2911_28620 [Caldilineaceae bacterium]